MDTATFLNIDPKANKTGGSLIGKAAVQDLFAAKEANGFKSAYKIQLNKHAEEKFRLEQDNEKSLPQSGNRLPGKENDSDKQLSHRSEQGEAEINNNSDTRESHESETEQQHVSRQAAEKKPVNQDVKTDTNTSADVLSEEEKTEIQSSDIVNNISEQQQHELMNQANDSSTNIENLNDRDNSKPVSKITSSVVTEAMTGELREPVNAESIKTAFTTPESVSDLKKTNAESMNGSKNSNHSLVNAQSVADLSSRTGSESKGDTALGKSVADFQSYIEMSKKHSAAGESIAAVKGFQENLKTEQLNAQLLRNEIKMPPGQNVSPAQLAMQGTATERSTIINPSLSTALSQSTPSLEVKAGVGKPGWNQGFASQISTMVANGIQHAKIRLNPAHLGPVEVMVKITGESAVVNLASLHLTTKEAMDSAIPRLKEMLNENGFSQVDVNVSHQDKKAQQEANFSSSKERSNSEHGNSTMPGEEQLTEDNHDSESVVNTKDSLDQDLNIVDYYA